MGTPAECIDHSICQKMEELVEQLTTSGKPVLNAEKMKHFKNICRISDMYVKHAYHLVQTQLKKDHAEIRLSAFQMMDELFNRSHQFRELLVNDFQDFLDLVVETDPELPLPPPKSAAKTLKSSAYKSIQQWYTKFGDAYRKLGLGYNFLKNCKKVDFDDILARSIAERKREEEKERKRQENLKRKMLIALKEMEDSIQDINLCLLEAENCFQLLLPSPDEFFISSSCHGDFGSANRKAQKVSSAKEKGVTPIDSELEHLADTRCVASSFNTGNDVSSSQQINSNSLSQESNAMPANKSDKYGTAVFSKYSNNAYSKLNSVHESHCVPLDGEQENSLPRVDMNTSESDGKEKEASTFISQEEGTDYQSKKYDQFKGSTDFSQSVKANTENSDLKKLIRTGNVCEVGLSDSCTNSKDNNKKNEVECADVQSQGSESSTKEEDRMDKSVHSGNGDEDDNELDSSGDDSKYVEVGRNFLRTEYEERGSLVKEHGLGSSKYQISIQVEPAGVSVKKNADNQFIIQTLQDQYRLISTKFLPNIKRWIQEITKAGGADRDVKKAIDLKTKLENCKRKCLELDLVPADRGNIDSSDTDEDEFEEVQEKEGYEPVIPSHLRAEYGLEPLKPEQPKSKPKSKSSCIPIIKGKMTKSDWNLKNRVEEEDEMDPTSYKANIRKITEASSSAPTSTVTFEMLSSWNSAAALGLQTKPNPSSSNISTTTSVDQKEMPYGSGSQASIMPESRKKKLLEEAPNVKFGVDLEYWENPDKIEAPLVVKFDSLHRFWTPSEVQDEAKVSEDLATLTRRTYTYVGKFEPVKWKCRAPLPTGKLCERMDRVKCPFHGKIIARNDLGQPCDPKDIEKLVKEEATKQDETVPDWQDPELLADIEAATGVDLGSKGKGKVRGKGKGKGKSKEKKYPELTDISAIQNTARSRLEAKVLNKSSLKRVCKAMDQIAYKRIRDKFGNQFHYAYPK
ncbi:hypothetical protein CHS0354_003642 [Potamilus streckersoni]|uniref:UV-stimulated scaffold protein A C-terminal domain-containing protein n=1 Tax=Potamilus streckersoni TaxID=2493646 RepID=A0AAE0S921_9BIVA|nr:hypothetical protein CHS0354_003642 [Potamilus streckersoni]